jgi:hypothetical protein
VNFYFLSLGIIFLKKKKNNEKKKFFVRFSQLKPAMITPLLRKLIHDVPALTDQTIVPLRVC